MQSRSSPAPTITRDGSRWADSVLATLSLRDRAAQLVWPWILGDYVPEGSSEWRRISRFVREDHVGGFILSVGSPLDIAAKANALQLESALPLLMSADMETGAGFRARAGFFVPNAIDLGGATTFPLQMALGATRDTALAYAFGLATAREARALGIPIVFGPVLDVNNNPANPVIGARSFSEDPQLTARLGAANIRGLQDGGVLATGKHFPGHGDTETNSHLALSVVTASRARLDSVELVPFKAAIHAGVGAIMTFHGFLPALDSSDVPATLSPRIMTDLLRRQLGFEGLLVTDAMDMKGVVDKFGASEAATMAIAAGNDVLLMPGNVPGAIDAVVAGVRAGRYTEARLNASVRRVLVLKERFGLTRERLVPLDRVRSVVGDSIHQQLADRIAQRAVVLAKDSTDLVPLRREGTAPKVVAITYARRADLGAGTTFLPELRRGIPRLTSAFVNADDSDPRFDTPLRLADSADVVVVCSYVNINSESATAAAPRAFIEFVSTLISRGRRVVLVSFGTPYLLQQIPRAPAYLVAWGGSPSSQRAAARALLGTEPIDGTLPIVIPPLLPLGAGIHRAAVSPKATSP
ncbi:MAG: glycoside hydrolase family 3 N-terminal domain-containing protein [Gemmatimonadaceae bacterium]